MVHFEFHAHNRGLAAENVCGTARRCGTPDTVQGFVWLLMAALELPAGARATLDARYPGWKPAPVAPQIAAWFRDYRFRWDPKLLRGDFDGDGSTDYVALIVAGGRERTVVLMARGAGYTVSELTVDRPDPYLYLLLYGKGEKDFDFERGKPFRYARDAIGVMYFSRTPLTFSWRGGRFERRLVLSDEEVDR